MIRNIALLALAVLFAVALSEGVLRATGMVPIDGVFTVDEREFEAIPGIFSPDRRADVAGVLPHTVSINSLGYRGPELSREKPPGEVRVFMTGDSFVFGDLVSDSATLPLQLESMLQRRCERVRVINGGVGGTTITAQTEMVKRGLQIEPDLVLLQFNENDIRDLADIPSWERLEANRAAKSRFPLSIAYPVLRETALWNLSLQLRARARDRGVEEAFAATMEESPRDSGEAPQEEGPPEPQDARRETLRAEYAEHLEALSGSLSAQSVPLVVSVFPNHATVYEEDATAQVDWFVALAEDLGIPVVNLLPALRASALPDTVLYLLPHDGHPGPEGYRIAASALADTLTSTALDPVCAGG